MQQPMIIPWQNKLHSLCIGFAGSPLTGKTTTSRHVCKYLDIPFINDIQQDYLIEKKLIKSTLSDQQLFKVFVDLLVRKKSMERSYTKFVSDTTTLDYSTEVLARVAHRPELQDQVLSYIRECALHAAQAYDCIFVMPYADDGPEPAWRALYQLLIEKSVEDGQPIFRAHIVASDTEADRTTECLEIIDRISMTKANVEQQRTGLKPQVTRMTQ